MKISCKYDDGHLVGRRIEFTLQMQSKLLPPLPINFDKVSNSKIALFILLFYQQAFFISRECIKSSEISAKCVSSHVGGCVNMCKSIEVLAIRKLCLH